MISKLRLGYGIFEYSAVIQSVSVGIKAKPHFATLDCNVATSLLLAMTNGKLTSNLPFACKARTHQADNLAKLRLDCLSVLF